MAEELRAIPDLLSYLGNELAEHGQSLLDLHQSCHRDADDVRPGWVGLSAEALSGLLDRWATASTRHHARFADHSRGMQFVAAGLAELERRNATTVSRPTR